MAVFTAIPKILALPAIISKTLYSERSADSASTSNENNEQQSHQQLELPVEEDNDTNCEDNNNNNRGISIHVGSESEGESSTLALSASSDDSQLTRYSSDTNSICRLALLESQESYSRQEVAPIDDGNNLSHNNANLFSDANGVAIADITGSQSTGSAGIAATLNIAPITAVSNDDPVATTVNTATTNSTVISAIKSPSLTATSLAPIAAQEWAASQLSVRNYLEEISATYASSSCTVGPTALSSVTSPNPKKRQFSWSSILSVTAGGGQFKRIKRTSIFRENAEDSILDDESDSIDNCGGNDGANNCSDFALGKRQPSSCFDPNRHEYVSFPSLDDDDEKTHLGN